MDPFFAKVTADLIKELLTSRLKSSDKDQQKSEGLIEQNEAVLGGIGRHLKEVLRWSDTVQFFGMGTPRALNELTVALDMDTEPRRFRDVHAKKSSMSESDLLTQPEHCLLLGEPGSGKTTTLKRLARRLLLDPPRDESDTCQYPLSIRLRELSFGESIFTRLALVFGLKVEQVEIVTRIENKENRSKKERSSAYDIKQYETKVDGQPIEDVVADILEATKAFLLLDGLDEVSPEHRGMLREEFVLLGRKLHNARILTSCRSGDYTAQMPGFNVVEICPLSASQVMAIKQKWLGDLESDDFLDKLRSVPYYDLADRPLLLTQLLFLYRRYGYLPEQPAMIYKKIVRLLLEEWDSERGIVRKSKYASFDPERKATFLEALAFHVTYVLKEKSFSESDLASAYMAIRAPFNLPETEAIQVAREIQTHTGIIVAGPRDTYEFCHLSLQEYLCASNLVRDPFVTGFGKKLSSYVAPLAVAVTLSSRPGGWLGKLMLEEENYRSFDDASMVSFVSRLVLERPFFETSEPLAFALFRLFESFGRRKNTVILSKLQQLVDLPGAVESVASGLRWYTISGRQDENGLIKVKLNIGGGNPYSVPAPSVGALPVRLLPKILEITTEPVFAMVNGARRILKPETARSLATPSRE